MDEAGVVADVIFAGGENDDVLPFYTNDPIAKSNSLVALSGAGGVGPVHVPAELRSIGEHIWNCWMVDYVSASPERLVCAMQIPISDVGAAVREVEWGRERGLRAVNFPAPRRDFPPYNDPIYEPLWDACEDLQIPLLAHVGGGDLANYPSTSGRLMAMAEVYWLNRRSLWHLIFGGVFERHPSLKVVFTEQRCSWVPAEIDFLDSIYDAALRLDSGEVAVMPPPGLLSSELSDLAGLLPMRPSEYFAQNCFIGASYMAPFEAAMRYDIGLENLLWGSDYPHIEGTWPDTRLAIRHALAELPEEEVRLILGENAMCVFNLDERILRPIAERIGPTPSEVARPVTEDELPVLRSLAFRQNSYLT